MDDKIFQRTLRETLPRFHDAKTPNEIEQYTTSIVNSLLDAINASTPKRRINPNQLSVPGFTEACKRAQMEARRLKRIDSDEHTDTSREAYRIARNRKGRVIGKALRAAYRERVEEACKSPVKMWKLAKWSRNRENNTYALLPALKDTAGQLKSDAADKANLLCQAFFPTPPDPDLSDIEGFEYPAPIILGPITKREIRDAITKAPANKAPGVDGIPNKILHKAINQILVHLEHLFNACLQIGHCPEHFKTSTTIVLRKLGKESY